MKAESDSMVIRCRYIALRYIISVNSDVTVNTETIIDEITNIEACGKNLNCLTL